MIRLLSISLMSIIAMILSAQMLTSNPSATDVATKAPAKPRKGDSTYYAATVERTVLQRDRSGQFHLTGQVNGQDVRFLVDTGADVVALTVADAESLNIDFNPTQFEEITRTASGAGMGQVVTIDRLEVGGMEFSNVQAIVVEGLDVNLLGQSVLRQMGKVELAGDRMVIHKG
jgi:aspartyl protease family protein